MLEMADFIKNVLMKGYQHSLLFWRDHYFKRNMVNVSSVEGQKGVNAVQRCSIENLLMPFCFSADIVFIGNINVFQNVNCMFDQFK